MTTPNEDLQADAERIKELEKLVYVPGMRKCAKCKCVLISNFLHADSGMIAANNKPQQCPNDCGPMWPVTERESGNEMADRLIEAQAKLQSAFNAGAEAMREKAAQRMEQHAYKWGDRDAALIRALPRPEYRDGK
jgi:hypothetical protein